MPRLRLHPLWGLRTATVPVIAAVAAYLGATVPAPCQILTDALSAAYETSPDLKAARAALDARNELRPQALSNWLPTVRVTGQGTRAVNSVPTAPPQFPLQGSRINDAIGQANLAWPITSGGGEFAKLRQAEDLIRQQRAILLESEESLLANGATVYTAVLADEEQLHYQIVNRDHLRQFASNIARLVAIGDRTAADLALVQARLAQAESAVAGLRGQLKEDRASYRQVIGEYPGTLHPPKPLTILPSTLEDAIALAERSNPNLVAADFAEQAARDGVAIADALLLPIVSLNAFWQRDLRTTQQRFPTVNGAFDQAFVGLQITVPLYQAGAVASQVRQAKKTAAQSLFQRDSALRAAVAAVKQSWARREAAIAQVESNSAQVAAAEAAVANYQRELGAGLATVLELLDSYQQLVGAQIALSQSRQVRIVADFQVLSLIGGLTARSLHLPVRYYDAKGDYDEIKWKIFGLSIRNID